jgi:hypothetical protein
VSGTVGARSAWTNRLVQLPGSRTPVPGLWVACHPRGGYAIVHEASGCVVGSDYSDPEAALAAAVECGPLADWSAPCDDGRMELPSAVVDQLDAIIRRWGGSGITVHRRG